MRLGVLLLAYFQADRVAQGLQAAHCRVALTGGVQLLKEMRAEIMVVLIGTQHVVDDDQQTVADGHDGAFGPNAASQAMVVG